MKPILASLAVLMALPAAAREPCLDRETITQRLIDTYGEAQAAWGLASGQIVEVWVAPSGSWTLLRSLPGGVSCVMATGQNWQAVESKPEGDAL